MNISHRTAIVTGASRGLGEALAQRLARECVRVVLVGRQREPLLNVVESIRLAGGIAHALTADLGDKYAIHPLAGAAAELVGPIELLIHNASELGPTPLRSLLDTECEDLERVLAVNLVGPFRLSKAVAGSMALRRHGTIVNVTSDASVNAYPGWGAYSMSKAALDQLGRSLGAELGEHGVRVFTVDPGEMDTVMHRAALPDADVASLARPDAVAERIVRMIGSGAVPSGARLEAATWSAP